MIRKIVFVTAIFLSAGVASGMTLGQLRFPTLKATSGGAGNYYISPLELKTDVGILEASSKTPYCVTNPYQTMGQSWVTAVSNGGITKKANFYSAQYPDFGTVFGLSASALKQRSGKINIFVVDIFESIDVKMKETNVPAYVLPLSHGSLVVSHMIAVLESAGYSNKSISGDGIKLSGGGGEILITKVRIKKNDHYLVEDLVRKLKDLKSDAAIFNMSFAVMPCEALAHYRTIRDFAENKGLRYNFSQFMNDTWRLTQKAFPGVTLAEVEEAITTLPLGNPLRVWLAQSSKNRIIVAASGNYSMKTAQTWPAAGLNVIGSGIARSFVPSTKRAEMSDKSDVLTLGEWFKISPGAFYENCKTLNTCVTSDMISPSGAQNYLDFGYRGTSFAAPSVSAFLALRRLEAFNGCFSGSLGFKKIPGKLGDWPFYSSSKIHQNCP